MSAFPFKNFSKDGYQNNKCYMCLTNFMLLILCIFLQTNKQSINQSINQSLN